MRLTAAEQRIEVEYVVVTPEMAMEWLEANTNNRHVRQSRVAQYAAEMRAGHWRTTHQGIAFGKDGSLYDGQHRLWAIVEAQVPIALAVTRGLGDEARGEIDTCTRRTLGDNFAILTGQTNAKRVVEAAGIIRMLVTGFSGATRGGSFTETEEYVEKYRAGVEWAAALPIKRQVGNASVRGALAFAHKTDPARIQEFALQVWEGEGLAAAAPSYVLRDYLLARQTNSKSDRRELAVKTLRAAAAHLGGELMPGGKLHATEDATAYFGLAHELTLTTATAGGLSSFMRRIKSQPRVRRV